MSAATIEEIQKEKGKPARVVKATAAKLSDVRKFSGSIEGMQQSYAISKMSDPLAKINVQVGSSVQKDQVLAEYIFTGDNTQYQQAQEQVALLEKATERMRELHAKGGISQQDMDTQEMQLKIAKMNLETARRATKILAPAAGVVTELNYKVGQTPGLGGVFCTIAKLNQVILKLNVTSNDIGYFKKGDKGKQVKNLQKFLKWYGYKIKVDGKCGKNTIKTVKKFQKAVGMKATGRFGKKTLVKAKAVKK